MAYVYCLYNLEIFSEITVSRASLNVRKCLQKVLSSIAQWLEPRSSNPVIVVSSPGGGRHICACHIEV